MIAASIDLLLIANCIIYITYIIILCTLYIHALISPSVADNQYHIFFPDDFYTCILYCYMYASHCVCRRLGNTKTRTRDTDTRPNVSPSSRRSCNRRKNPSNRPTSPSGSRPMTSRPLSSARYDLISPSHLWPSLNSLLFIFPHLLLPTTLTHPTLHSTLNLPLPFSLSVLFSLIYALARSLSPHRVESISASNSYFCFDERDLISSRPLIQQSCMKIIFCIQYVKRIIKK